MSLEPEEELSPTSDMARQMGRMETKLANIVTHLRKQDADSEARERGRQQDKKLAIAARVKLAGKVDKIGELTTQNAEWIQKFGIPMAEADAARKLKRELRNQRVKGALGVYASLAASAGLVGSALVWMGKDAIAAVLAAGAALLKNTGN